MRLLSKELYLFQSRILTHVIFWACYYVFFSFLWAKDDALFQSFQLELVLMPVRIAASYVSMYYLVVTYLAREKLVLFALAYLLLISIAGLLQRFLIFFFHEYFFNANDPLWRVSSIIRSIVLVNSTTMLLTSFKIYRLWMEARKIGGHSQEKALEIRSDKRTHRVLPSSILYLEGLGNYLTIYLQDKSLISYMTLKEAEQMLPANFQRIHKSFIVNTHEVESFTHENLQIGTRIIPIGKSYTFQGVVD